MRAAHSVEQRPLLGGMRQETLPQLEPSMGEATEPDEEHVRARAPRQAGRLGVEEHGAREIDVRDPRVARNYRQARAIDGMERVERHRTVHVRALDRHDARKCAARCAREIARRIERELVGLDRRDGAVVVAREPLSALREPLGDGFERRGNCRRG
jgi:hypothetical protein